MMHSKMRRWYWQEGSWQLYGTPFRPARLRTRFFLKPPLLESDDEWTVCRWVVTFESSDSRPPPNPPAFEEHHEIKTFIRRIEPGVSFGTGYVAEKCNCSPREALAAINSIREHSAGTLEGLGFGIYRWL